MVGVTSTTSEDLDISSLKKLAERVLEGEGAFNKDVSVVLVEEEKMRELNTRYRGKEGAANVLSFPSEELGLGEVVLCPAQIRKEALEYGIVFEQELVRMLVHGLLHLLSYSHEGSKEEALRMERRESHYL